MFQNKYIPLTGRFLVSEPFLKDKDFHRTVVLLTEHNDENSLGYILNRKLDVKLNDLIQDAPDFNAPIYLGGPVGQDTLHFIHRLGNELHGTVEIGEGLYWNGDFEQLLFKIRSGVVSIDDICFFVGYAGWDKGQLAKEIAQKTWIVAPENTEIVFEVDHTHLWHNVLHGMGDTFKVISHFPEDPRLN